MEELLTPDMRETIVRALLALLALVAIYALRHLVIRALLPVIRRLVRRSNTDVDDIILNAITVPVRLLVLALALHVGFSILLPGGFPPFLQHFLRSLVIVALFAAAYKAVGVLARSTWILARYTGLQVDEQLLPYLRLGLQVVLVALAVVIVLQEWEYDVASLIAGLGLGGLAVALAAQETLANLFGFTTIVGDRPLTVGEFIITPDVTGIVERVGLRSTRIRQLDRALVTIPNSKLANSVITNWSRLEKRWVNFTFGVTYATSSAQMRELIARIREMLTAREHVVEDTITVLFTNFGDSSLDVLVRAYVTLPDWTDYMTEQQEIMLAIMDILAEMGLSFAFPSRSLYIEQMPGADGSQATRLAGQEAGETDEADARR